MPCITVYHLFYSTSDFLVCLAYLPISFSPSRLPHFEPCRSYTISSPGHPFTPPYSAICADLGSINPFIHGLFSGKAIATQMHPHNEETIAAAQQPVKPMRNTST